MTMSMTILERQTKQQHDKSKPRLTRNTGNNSTTNVEIAVRLKCLSNFCRTLEMTLINSEVALDLIC